MIGPIRLITVHPIDRGASSGVPVPWAIV